MSCTENDSGPFVVFFLPAVVGCLTILLARRWANSQVTNTSSTAVSRRRKIIKDPLIKRPPPPIACKMVPTGSKKSGVVKRVAFPANDEDLVTSGKRAGKSNVTRPPNGILVDSSKHSDAPVAPKHIPFPYIPQDGEFLFELMTFVFVIVATGLQFLNLYRTAWWLPHSHTTQPMNFHLIDPPLVTFIVVITSRRMLLSLILTILRTFVSEKLMTHAANIVSTCVLGVILGASAWCAYYIILKYDYPQIFYLFYPTLVYFILFGMKAGPFLSLQATAPLHCCSQDPQHVRTEVDSLRTDFNTRLKTIVFNSMFEAYYSSFLPCCFAQPFLYYDVYAASQQAVFVWGALCGRYAAQLAGAACCDVPHRASLHLGRWRPENRPIESSSEAALWSGARLYARGARARVRGAGGGAGAGGADVVLVADASCVAATPLDPAHKRFYTVFINPSYILCASLCLQMALIVVQIVLLFSNTAWHNFLAIVILLFINYYTLFKMVRDYLVAWKVYKAEHMIQDRNGTVTAGN